MYCTQQKNDNQRTIKYEEKEQRDADRLHHVECSKVLVALTVMNRQVLC